MHLVAPTRGGKTTLIYTLLKQLIATGKYKGYFYHEYGCPVLPFLNQVHYSGPCTVLDGEIAFAGYSNLREAPVLLSLHDLIDKFGTDILHEMGYDWIEKEKEVEVEGKKVVKPYITIHSSGKEVTSFAYSDRYEWLDKTVGGYLSDSIAFMDSLDTAVIPSDLPNPFGRDGYELGGLSAARSIQRNHIESSTRKFRSMITTYYLPPVYWSRLAASVQWFAYIRLPLPKMSNSEGTVSGYDFNEKADGRRLFGFLNPLNRSEVYEVPLVYKNNALQMPDSFYELVNLLASYPSSSIPFNKSMTELLEKSDFERFSDEVLFDQIKLEIACDEKGMTIDAAAALAELNKVKLTEAKLRLDKKNSNTPEVDVTKSTSRILEIQRLNQAMSASKQEVSLDQRINEAIKAAGIADVNSLRDLTIKKAAIEQQIDTLQANLNLMNFVNRDRTVTYIQQLNTTRQAISDLENTLKNVALGYHLSPGSAVQ